MTDNYILSIDPGLESGISVLSYTEETLPVLEYATQFRGGAEGMSDWFSSRQVEPHIGFRVDAAWIEPEDVICEAFTARNTKNFNYTTVSLEALPVIGVLIDRGLVDRNDRKRYRDPKFQYLVGGDSLADKKKRRDQFLEDSGYYVGRKEIGETLKDYNDARSSVAHGIAYLAREMKHKPTFTLLTEWVEDNG
jgi:hypothetical protein